MNKHEVKEFVQKLIYTIWENQEVDKLEEFYTLDVEGDYHGDKVNFDSLKNKVKIFDQHMKELKIEILHLLVEEDKYALHVNQKFIDSKGKEMKIPAMLFAHLHEGRVSKYWVKTKMPLIFI